MMRIESLKTSPDRSGRFWVKLDNGDKIALYRQTVEDFSLYAGKELSEQEWTALEEAAGAMSAKMRAVRIVAASSVSKKDLQQRLVRKGEDPKQAAEAVAWMEALHLVDDEDTARQIVARCVARGCGISRAKQMLYEKKIPQHLWDSVLTDFPDQTEHILAFLQSRADELSDPKGAKKAIDALLRRGHRYSEIRNALGLLALDTDEFPEE